MAPDGTFSGREAIEKYYEEVFKQVHLSNNRAPVDEDSLHMIGTAGNEIWATGKWTATFKGQNFGPVEAKGAWWQPSLSPDRLNLFPAAMKNVRRTPAHLLTFETIPFETPPKFVLLAFGIWRASPLLQSIAPYESIKGTPAGNLSDSFFVIVRRSSKILPDRTV